MSSVRPDPIDHATYEDLVALPSNQVGEIVAGTLYTSPRPAPAHTLASSALGEELGPPFRRGKGGPGGWIILDEPELHLGTPPNVLVPDLAGWRNTTLPQMPTEAAFTTAPDWVCEVLSPSTRTLDRIHKVPVYATYKVSHVWLVDPIGKSIEVLQLDGASYRLAKMIGSSVKTASIEPFDAIEIDVYALWQWTSTADSE